MTRTVVSSRKLIPAAALLLVAWGCSEAPDGTTAPEIPVTPAVGIRDLAQVIAVQERHTPQLMRRAGVVGTAVAIGTDGEPVVLLLAQHTAVRAGEPLEGVPVELLLTGRIFAKPPIVAQPKPTCGVGQLPPCEEDPPGGNPPSLPPESRFPRPVPLGVSTGHPAITAGTIGVRLVDGTGSVFALSNNHVYANMNLAGIGDAVIQPGTFDGGASPADDIGNLSAFVPIDFTGACTNTVDAAIASTTTALVGNATHPDGYGTPKSATIAPALNMKVKKYGRTTELTTGTIGAINATVNVSYGAAGVACFTNQIIITPGSFSAGGDSGSLIVVDGKGRARQDDRRPVGLLFAGSIFSTIANPIDLVLDEFPGLAIDGD